MVEIAAIREGMLLNGLPPVSRSLCHWLASSVGLPDRRGPICAVVTARDEQVRLPEALRHLVQQGADHLVVADHMSSDRTAEVVAELARDLPVTALEDREPGGYQARKVSRLAHAACRRGRGASGGDADIYPAPAIDHLPTLDVPDATDPFVEIVRCRTEPSTNKVAFRDSLLAAVHQGNHWVNVPAEARRGCLEIRHFPFRSVEHLRRKIETHMKSFERTPDIVMGSHVVQWPHLDVSTLRRLVTERGRPSSILSRSAGGPSATSRVPTRLSDVGCAEPRMTERGRAGEPVELSVIIAARNAADVLPAMLTTLAAQTWTGAWEVIVADNGSVDDTAAVAETFSSVLPRLRVIDAGQAPGQAHARNVGVTVAEGTSIAFVDADDEVEPGYVATMAEALRRERFVAARLDCDALNAGWVRHSRPAPAPADGLGAPFGWLPVAPGCSLGVRRDLFVDAGGFDIELPPAEDIDCVGGSSGRGRADVRPGCGHPCAAIAHVSETSSARRVDTGAARRSCTGAIAIMACLAVMDFASCGSGSGRCDG